MVKHMQGTTLLLRNLDLLLPVKEAVLDYYYIFGLTHKRKLNKWY